jgi:hypothetical protein
VVLFFDSVNPISLQLLPDVFMILATIKICTTYQMIMIDQNVLKKFSPESVIMVRFISSNEMSVAVTGKPTSTAISLGTGIRGSLIELCIVIFIKR